MERVEFPQNYEVQSGGGTVRLEYGVHALDVLGVKTSDSLDRFNEGDMSAHYWNEEVLERVSRYKPSFICSDSMPQLVDSDLQYVDQATSWYTLPGSPSQISGKNYVYSVAADYFGARAGDDEKFVKESATTYLKEDVSAFFIGVAAIIAAKVISNKISSYSTETAIPRREFLRKAVKYGAYGTGVAFATLPLIRWISAYGAGRTDSRFLHDFFSKVADITRHRFSPSTWVDGRSALIIAKALEVPNHLPESSRDGAVILGFPHVFEAQGLFESEESRAEKIRSFIRMIAETVREFNGEVLTDQELKEAAIDHFTRTAILKLKEPESPGESLNGLVTVHALYRTPEIERALHSLTF